MTLSLGQCFAKINKLMILGSDKGLGVGNFLEIDKLPPLYYAPESTAHINNFPSGIKQRKTFLSKTSKVYCTGIHCIPIVCDSIVS